MELFRGRKGEVTRVGVFPGSFNPPTVAHLAMAQAALAEVDEVVFVLPRAFPHKEFRDTSLEQRLDMLRAATAAEPRFAVAVAEGGLFIEIARECRAAYGPAAGLSFLCGRDAAERIANWDYGRKGVWREMLLEFDLLVAPRAGEYRPSEHEREGVRTLEIGADCDAVSASEVRRRIASGENWADLVPEAIRDQVRELYRPY
jgi:nicotinate (nicotinamide) nucleotide adenylyltransferase